IGAPLRFSAILTTSMARTTPAQNPRGLRRMIFLRVPTAGRAADWLVSYASPAGGIQASPSIASTCVFSEEERSNAGAGGPSGGGVHLNGTGVESSIQDLRAGIFRLELVRGRDEPESFPCLSCRMRLLLRRDETFAYGEQDEFRGAVNVHLFHQVRPMHGDGVHAQVEKLGDLFVGFALCDQLQDLLFASS